MAVCGVRIEPVYELENACSVPRIVLEGGITINGSLGHEAESLTLGFSLSFLPQGVHSNKQTRLAFIRFDAFFRRGRG